MKIWKNTNHIMSSSHISVFLSVEHKTNTGFRVLGVALILFCLDTLDTKYPKVFSVLTGWGMHMSQKIMFGVEEVTNTQTKFPQNSTHKQTK